MKIHFIDVGEEHQHRRKCLKNPNNYYFNRNQPISWVLLVTKILL